MIVNNGMPIYKQIKKFILDNIENKVISDGDKIPTEYELIELFKTSRPTVNKAMNELAIEGIIERLPRKGSFVKKQLPSVSIMTLQNLQHEVEHRGNKYSYKIIKQETIKSNSAISEKLLLKEGQNIFSLIVLHLENNIPIRYDIRYINILAFDKITHQDFNKVTPEIYLQSQSPFDEVNNIIEAIIPDSEISKYLEINQTSPCLLISRLVKSRNLYASYSKLYYPSERYQLSSIIK